MRRFIGIVVASLMMFSLSASVVSAATIYTDSTVSDRNSAGGMRASNSSGFVWLGMDNVLYYSDGTSRTVLSSNWSNNYESVKMSEHYIAWVELADSTPSRIFIYNIVNHQKQQIANNVYVTTPIAISDSAVAWVNSTADSSSQSPSISNVQEYDIATGITHNVTNNTERYHAYFVALVDNDLYYSEQLNNSTDQTTVAIYDLNLLNGDLQQIVSGSGGYFLEQGEAGIGWIADLPTGERGKYTENVYYYDGTTVRLVDSVLTCIPSAGPPCEAQAGLLLKGHWMTWGYSGPKGFGTMVYDTATQSQELIDGSFAEVNNNVLAYAANNNLVVVKNLVTGEASNIALNEGPYQIDMGFPGSIAVMDNYIAFGAEIDPSNLDNIFVLRPSVLPSAPINLTAQSPTNQKPALNWSGVTGANSYKIYRDGSLVGTSTSVGFNDVALSTDGTYTYKVTAVNASGESAFSNPVTVIYDTTAPTGTFSSSALVIRLLGANIQGTASDSLSGVDEVKLSKGATALSSKTGGITLSCNVARTSCTWSVTNPNSLTLGSASYTLTVVDKAGNTKTITMNIIVI